MTGEISRRLTSGNAARWLLLGARVIDPATQFDGVTDLLVEANLALPGVRKIDHRAALELAASAPGSEQLRVLDLEGLVVTPAFVELHAHLREPGGEESETIATGLAAARAGGYGTVLAMANTNPVNDDPDVTRAMLRAAAAANTGVTLLPVTAATKGLLGQAVAPWAAQVAAGCVAISDDGKPVHNHGILAEVLAAARALGVPYLSHAECPKHFVGPIHDGAAAARFGVRGIPVACESDAVREELLVAERMGGHLHVCHVSTKESIDGIRAARLRGVSCSAEATPHHLLLTDDAFLERGPDTSLKMNPPLRPARDRDALRAALLDGTVAAIGTDHAPHAPRLKARPLADAPFGVIGMETAFALLHEHLVRQAGWPLAVLVERMTSGPAALASLRAGRIFDAPPALAILDERAHFRVDASTFHSKSRNCPFDGWEGRGRVVGTLLGSSFLASSAPGTARASEPR